MLLAALLLALAAAAAFLTQPVLAGRRPGRTVDPERLRRHVERLARDLVPRDLGHLGNLDAAAAYVRGELERTGGRVEEQPYLADGRAVRNVVARFGPAEGARVVVGAHYDAFGGLPGADDNASGTAGLLELATLLGQEPPRGPVELVAYTLEEPPTFGSPLMGSAVHARSLREAGVPVRAMIGLEMIGDFSDAPGSQTYPVPLLGLLYPRRGDFVAVAGRPSDWRLTRLVKRAMRSAGTIPVRSINAPPRVAGLDLSDHASYWAEGLTAVMVTDTAFFRNARYHTPDDTPERLDYRRMAAVVSAVHRAVEALSSAP